MKIYMIRHGESTANAERKHAGWAQVPLTERGRADAIAAGALIEGLHFDRVYVSDLIRARETMELALPNTEAIESPLLREISVGELAGPHALRRPRRGRVSRGVDARGTKGVGP